MTSISVAKFVDVDNAIKPGPRVDARPFWSFRVRYLGNNEFVTRFYQSSIWQRDCDYFTDSASDAHAIGFTECARLNAR